MAIIGIDLGTINSLAAVWRNGRSELIPNAAGDVLTPSGDLPESMRAHSTVPGDLPAFQK